MNIWVDYEVGVAVLPWNRHEIWPENLGWYGRGENVIFEIESQCLQSLLFRRVTFRVPPGGLDLCLSDGSVIFIILEAKSCPSCYLASCLLKEWAALERQGQTFLLWFLPSLTKSHRCPSNYGSPSLLPCERLTAERDFKNVITSRCDFIITLKHQSRKYYPQSTSPANQIIFMFFFFFVIIITGKEQHGGVWAGCFLLFLLLLLLVCFSSIMGAIIFSRFSAFINFFIF